VKERGKETIPLKRSTRKSPQLPIAQQRLWSRSSQDSSIAQSLEHRLQGGNPDTGSTRKSLCHNLLVLFRLKRTSGVQKTAARRQTFKRSRENLLLTRSLTAKIRWLQPMTDLWVTPESSSSTTRDITKNKVEEPFTLRKPRSIRLKRANLRRNRIETYGKSLKPPRIGIGSQQLGIAMATRKNKRLTTRSSTAVPYPLRRCMSNSCQLSNQEGTIVKMRQSPLRKILIGEEAT
jgi:hypothetical protein